MKGTKVVWRRGVGVVGVVKEEGKGFPQPSRTA